MDKFGYPGSACTSKSATRIVVLSPGADGTPRAELSPSKNVAVATLNYLLPVAAYRESIVLYPVVPNPSWGNGRDAAIRRNRQL